jgi:putative transposase
VVFWRLRYKLSLRDLPEMFLIWGIEFSYEAVRDREAKPTPSLIDSSRRRRKGRIGRSWYVDETYIKVQGTLVLSLSRDRSLWRSGRCEVERDA